jgi:hypothetical protein
LAIKSGIVIEANLIVIAIEAAGDAVAIVLEAVHVAVDLEVGVAGLHIEVIMVAVDRNGQAAVADVDDVVIAGDIEVPLFVLNVLLGVIVKDVHPINDYIFLL